MQPGKGAPCPPRSTLSCPIPTAALTLPPTQGGRACPPCAPTEPCSWPLVAPGHLPLLDKRLGEWVEAWTQGRAWVPSELQQQEGWQGLRHRAGGGPVQGGGQALQATFRGKKQGRGAAGSPPARPRHHSGRAASCSPPYGNSQPLHLPGLSPSHQRHRSLPTRRWTTFRWTRRRPRPCRTPCRSGQTCGSPRSPPRAPSCDAPRPGRGPEAPSAEPASGRLALRLCSAPSCPPPLSSATLAVKALGIRDPDPFPLGGEGLIEALPPPSPDPSLIFISNGHPTLVRALAKRHPRASACPSDPNIYRTCGGGAGALSRLRTSPAGLQLLGSPPRPRRGHIVPLTRRPRSSRPVRTRTSVPLSLGRGGARPPKGGGAAEEGQRRS